MGEPLSFTPAACYRAVCRAMSRLQTQKYHCLTLPIDDCLQRKVNVVIMLYSTQASSLKKPATDNRQ
jgi:hypothetical protein